MGKDISVLMNREVFCVIRRLKSDCVLTSNVGH